MDNFKTTFPQAQQELRDQQRTAQQAGFQANGIWCQPTQNNDHPLQETAEALANLATATASDRQALQNLTNTVKELSNQIKAKDRQIEDLIKAMNGNEPMGNNPRSTTWEKKDYGSYCHTHGYLEYNPDDLIGKTFLLPKNEQGIRHRATIKRKVIETSKLLDN